MARPHLLAPPPPSAVPLPKQAWGGLSDSPLPVPSPLLPITLSRSRRTESPAPQAREGEGLSKQPVLIRFRPPDLAGPASCPDNGKKGASRK